MEFKTGKDAVVNGNIVRGFFIHNGAPIQGPVWRGTAGAVLAMDR